MAVLGGLIHCTLAGFATAPIRLSGNHLAPAPGCSLMPVRATISQHSEIASHFSGSRLEEFCERWKLLVVPAPPLMEIINAIHCQKKELISLVHVKHKSALRERQTFHGQEFFTQVSYDLIPSGKCLCCVA